MLSDFILAHGVVYVSRYIIGPVLQVFLLSVLLLYLARVYSLPTIDEPLSSRCVVLLSIQSCNSD